MERAVQRQPSRQVAALPPRSRLAGTSLPNSVLIPLLRNRWATNSPGRAVALQLYPAPVSVQRATRAELLAAYDAAVAGSSWNDAAVRLNGFNDADITTLVARLDKPKLLAVKDAALNVMQGWNARVVGPINKRLQSLMGTKVLHATANEIQDYLLHSPFLKTYVSSKFSGGNPIEGHIFVDDPAAFKAAFATYVMSKGKTRADADAMEPSVSAFRNGDDVHVHESRGVFTTTIHESMHRFSDAALLTQLGFNVNEGTTEYFTQIVCKDQGLTRAGLYESELHSIGLLVGVTSKATVADAYFSGAIPALVTAVDTAKGAGKFAQWKTHMQAGHYVQADRLLS